MKDATNSEMLRGEVRTQRSGGLRMGEPSTGNAVLLIGEYIAYGEATLRIETS